MTVTLAKPSLENCTSVKAACRAAWVGMVCPCMASTTRAAMQGERCTAVATLHGCMLHSSSIVEVLDQRHQQCWACRIFWQWS